MDPLTTAVLGAGLAFLASAVVLGLSLAIRRGRAGAALAVGLGFAIGQSWNLGRPSWPPAMAMEWTLPIAVLATAFGIVDASWRLPALARWGARGAISAALLGVTLRSLMLNSWEVSESAAWLVGLGLAAVAFWANLDALAERLPGPARSSAPAVVAGFGAGALLISGSFTLGGLGMALAAALAAVALLGLVSPGLAAGRGVAAVVAPILLALLANGVFYSELPRGAAALLVAAPSAAWLARVGPLRRLGPRATALAVAGIVAVPAGIALAMAVAASPPLGVEAEVFGGAAGPGIMIPARPGRRDDAESRRMCELMGMSFEGPVSADFSIREFALRGEENADGWGLGWYPDRSLAIVKEPVKWGESRYAGFLEEYPALRSRLYIAHVRHKTVGGLPTRSDTHPFAREFGGREYCFAHNGTILGFSSLELGLFRPLGSTDSEHVFCHLLSEVAANDPPLDAEEGWRWMHERLSALNRMGKLNVLVSDGERLFVYHDTGGWKGLNFRLVRIRGGEARHLEDADLAVDLDGSAVNRGIVVATRPLSPTGWHAIRTGELLVLEGGTVRFSSARSRGSSEFVSTPARPVTAST